MDEIWKDVIGYEGIYKISNTGFIKRLERRYIGSKKRLFIRPEIILKPCINSKGYSLVRLAKNNEQISFRIHRLVAIHFINNQNNLLEVNHKDGNKRNNNMNNLEWIDRKGNVVHAVKNNLFPDLRGSKNPSSKLNE